MSAYSGNTPKNRAEHKANKRREALARNAAGDAKMRACGHVHGAATAAGCESPAVTR